MFARRYLTRAERTIAHAPCQPIASSPPLCATARRSQIELGAKDAKSGQASPLSRESLARVARHAGDVLENVPCR
jgi:hypothetical protein